MTYGVNDDNGKLLAFSASQPLPTPSSLEVAQLITSLLDGALNRFVPFELGDQNSFRYMDQISVARQAAAKAHIPITWNMKPLVPLGRAALRPLNDAETISLRSALDRACSLATSVRVEESLNELLRPTEWAKSLSGTMDKIDECIDSVPNGGTR